MDVMERLSIEERKPSQAEMSEFCAYGYQGVAAKCENLAVLRRSPLALAACPESETDATRRKRLSPPAIDQDLATGTRRQRCRPRQYSPPTGQETSILSWKHQCMADPALPSRERREC